MTGILIVGAGKIGQITAEMLAGSGDYVVTLADGDPARLARLTRTDIATCHIDARDSAALRRAADGQQLVISTCPYFLNAAIATAAAAVGADYADVTEDVATARVIRDLARNSRTAFLPQCGLAPGFVSIVAHDLVGRFDRVRDVNLRVGALPLYPDNALKYNLTWSTDGLINEYCNPCDAIVAGRRVALTPLDGLEHISIEGVEYEAFNTSGGVGALCDLLEGRVENLDYKTLRYPGHRDLMAFLLTDLRLGTRQELLKEVLEQAIAVTHQDVVLIFVTAIGWRDGRLTQESVVKKIYGRELGGRSWSAIQLSTAAGLCAVVDLHREGALPARGYVAQENLPLDRFLANRFGGYYA